MTGSHPPWVLHIILVTSRRFIRPSRFSVTAYTNQFRMASARTTSWGSPLHGTNVLQGDGTGSSHHDSASPAAPDTVRMIRDGTSIRCEMNARRVPLFGQAPSICTLADVSHHDGENLDLPGQGFVKGLDESVDFLKRRERLSDFIGKPRVFFFRPFPDGRLRHRMPINRERACGRLRL